MDRETFNPQDTPSLDMEGRALPSLPMPSTGLTPAAVTSTQDDRLMAALAHASMWLNLVTGFLGLAVSGGIWLVYRNRQRWVAGQALQATFLQIVMILAIGASIVLLGLGSGLWWTIIGLAFFPLACLTGLLSVGLFAYSLYGALKVYNGEDFRYPVVGVVVDTP